MARKLIVQGNNIMADDYHSLNTDLGDGWEDHEVHKDPEEIRTQALKMGVNIFVYALTGR